jgi:small conductance mechanosensitive channel
VGTVEGTVEEVGLRRTVVRDATGTVHSISNGEIRIASNLTRLYASLLVDVPVVPGTDLDLAAAIVNRVGAEMAEDPDWRDRLLEPPRFARVVAVTDTGIMLRATGRIRATDRWEGPGEVRRRLLAAFAAEGIELAQRGRMVMVAEPAASRPPVGAPAEPAAAAPTEPAVAAEPADPGEPIPAPSMPAHDETRPPDPAGE